MKKGICELLKTEEGRNEFDRIGKDRLPKILALREKFGYYIVSDYPESIERFEALMQDEVPEPYRTLAEKEKIRRENMKDDFTTNK
ncbi:MAG: hypothetical protein RSA57_03955 [Cetobacterium sp.]|uniref:hypothetical protein n=1 Tax=Bacteria TaxID=2 RepID=UPI002FCC7ACD